MQAAAVCAETTEENETQNPRDLFRARILSQPTSLLHGTGVRGGMGVNAFMQLNLSIKSNLPPPSDRALPSRPSRGLSCVRKSGEKHGNLTVKPGWHQGRAALTSSSIAPACPLKMWPRWFRGSGGGGSIVQSN